MVEYVRRIRNVVGHDELLQIPSASIALRDGQGRVLLARHSEGDVWLLPGGAIEPTEVPADAVAGDRSLRRRQRNPIAGCSASDRRSRARLLAYPRKS